MRYDISAQSGFESGNSDTPIKFSYLSDNPDA